MAATQEDFRDAIANLATGVSIITTRVDGVPAGMTASAVASLSMSPRLLLVCVDVNLATHEAIARGGRFAVNILPEGAEVVALQFARPSADKFARIRLREGFDDTPVLDDALAYFVCDLRDRYPGGDHTIFVGEVMACGKNVSGKPLLYYNRRFGRLDGTAPALVT